MKWSGQTTENVIVKRELPFDDQLSRLSEQAFKDGGGSHDLYVSDDYLKLLQNHKTSKESLVSFEKGSMYTFFGVYKKVKGVPLPEGAVAASLDNKRGKVFLLKVV